MVFSWINLERFICSCFIDSKIPRWVVKRDRCFQNDDPATVALNILPKHPLGSLGLYNKKPQEPMGVLLWTHRSPRLPVASGYLVNCNSACQWYQQTTRLGCELRASAAMMVTGLEEIWESTYTCWQRVFWDLRVVLVSCRSLPTFCIS